MQPPFPSSFHPPSPSSAVETGRWRPLGCVAAHWREALLTRLTGPVSVALYTHPVERGGRDGGYTYECQPGMHTHPHSPLHGVGAHFIFRMRSLVTTCTTSVSLGLRPPVLALPDPPSCSVGALVLPHPLLPVICSRCCGGPKRDSS